METCWPKPAADGAWARHLNGEYFVTITDQFTIQEFWARLMSIYGLFVFINRTSDDTIQTVTSPRWLAISLCAALAACSNDDADDDDACSTSNVVDDEEVVNTTQALSPSEQRGVARVLDSLFGSLALDAAARNWAEAPRSDGHALVRDFVEAVLIDTDLEATSRFVDAAAPAARAASLAGVGGEARYTALRRLLVAGDLVLARSEGERAGAAREFYDLFRLSDGRVVERWSAERASLSSDVERLF
jgi:hypothetical protein